MQSFGNADPRKDGERNSKRRVAAAFAKAAAFMADGVSARAQSIMSGPPIERLADQRSPTRSKKQ